MNDKLKSTEYKRRFNEQNYDRIEITVKKGTKKVIQEVAKNNGESINSYIKESIKTRYKTDTGNDVDL